LVDDALRKLRMRGDLDPGELEYLRMMKQAEERQRQAWASNAAVETSDEARAKASADHMARTKRMFADTVQASPELPSSPAPVVTAEGATLGFYKAEPYGDVQPKPVARYAHDWPSMKKWIARSDGTWLVRAFAVPASAPEILKFFGKDESGMSSEPELEKAAFEVIVKDGRVFRSDPE